MYQSFLSVIHQKNPRKQRLFMSTKRRVRVKSEVSGVRLKSPSLCYNFWVYALCSVVFIRGAITRRNTANQVLCLVQAARVYCGSRAVTPCVRLRETESCLCVRCLHLQLMYNLLYLATVLYDCAGKSFWWKHLLLMRLLRGVVMRRLKQRRRSDAEVALLSHSQGWIEAAKVSI